MQTYKVTNNHYGTYLPIGTIVKKVSPWDEDPQTGEPFALFTDAEKEGAFIGANYSEVEKIKVDK